ncbi:MAG: ThuA domain-containing protein [Chloroflexi bacterium]|nr:ThuA domain-containing protein [Chloroflexota bacterium]OJV86904.1 MAG: trehalose utilization protein ThuA [Chloroflexi bacterium 54-19]
MTAPIRVTVWNEFRHEQHDPKIASVYPNGIHGAIAEGLKEAGFTVQTATLDEPEHGLTEEKLANTDVLFWWGHGAHNEVSDEIVNRVHKRVLDDGMGLIVLHSGHFSKIFKKLMGTDCDLKWREDGQKERLWIVSPGHPIVAGLSEYIELPQEEMYGEYFGIPTPDELVFVSWFPGGEVFRSGCTFTRGAGRIFYFRPGHEEYPTYYNAQVRQVLSNAANWAAPTVTFKPVRGNYKPLEKIEVIGGDNDILSRLKG